MDGIEQRSQFVVIATTNRPNAIDPALRRPGRYYISIEKKGLIEKFLLMCHKRQRDYNF